MSAREEWRFPDIDGDELVLRAFPDGSAIIGATYADGNLESNAGPFPPAALLDIADRLVAIATRGREPFATRDFRSVIKIEDVDFEEVPDGR